MNPDVRLLPIYFGPLANSDTFYFRWRARNKGIIAALSLVPSVDVGAGTTTAAVSAVLYNRGAAGDGTTVLARVTNDTTVYPAETAVTKAAAITDELGIRKDLSSANAAVLAQGDTFLHIQGTAYAAGDMLEVVVAAGSAATLVDANVTVEYIDGQN